MNPAVSSQTRKSPRRRTLIKARVLDGPDLGPDLLATDLSADGAFIRNAKAPEEVGSLRLSLVLPTDSRPIEVAAKLVRRSEAGIGVRFEEISARDRARLRGHAGFYEMDEAMVRLQRALGDLIPSNLLPLGEGSEIQAVLRQAVDRALPVRVIAPGRGFKPVRGFLEELRVGDDAGGFSDGASVRLQVGEDDLETGTSAYYLAFSVPPLHYAFEGLVLEPGPRPRLLVPERIYLTERRGQRREPVEGAWCELPAPWAPEGHLELPVLDLGELGVSVSIPPGSPLVPGTRLPAFDIVNDGERRRVDGATVRYVVPTSGESLRAGLRLERAEQERDTFQKVKRAVRQRGIRSTIMRSVSLLGGKFVGLLRRPDRRYAGGVEVVSYRNSLGNSVVGIIDANFNTSSADVRPDVAVVIAPAILKRKEVFGLLARTIVDDLDRDGHKVVVLRFDICNVVGESTMDPKLVAEGTPYYNWTLSQLVSDMEASLQYLERRFRPERRVLASVSLSAIPARKVVAGDAAPPVDLWIAPYGCPDAQDMFRNYLAGLELFADYEAGEGPESIMIHGRPIRGASLYGDARRGGMAFQEQAREDLSRIQAPVVWILGTYDHWVSRSRVRAMLEAPGGGVREVFECATGHVLKSGEEAIELFKLVSESISKHLFNADRPARDPNLARFALQSEREWARVKRHRLTDAEDFWKEHLFGEVEGGIGYDIMLDHPEYPRFLDRQVELLDPRPDEHLADLGCGTGNLLLAMLRVLPATGAAASVTFADLVPEGLERTEEKLLDFYAAGTAVPPFRALVADLEVSRLVAVEDFLAGRLHAIDELVNRIEGFDHQTARKLADSYGKELHAILRGRPGDGERIRQLCPELDDREVEIAEELGRACRFVLGEPLGEDIRNGVAEVRSAADLRFEHLNFAAATPHRRLDLPDACFDRIGCSLVIPYLYDPLASLREMHRLLKPGGVLVISSILPNFDPSKIYSEAVEIVGGEDGDGEGVNRKLEALRHFGNMVSRFIELEEDGRFHFHDGPALRGLASEAGFARAHAFTAFGSPPTAIILRAEK